MENVTLSEPATALAGIPFLLVLSIVVCLSFLTACVAVFLFRRMTVDDPSRIGSASELLLSTNSAFLFSDKKLVFMTSKGRALLDKLGGATNSWDKLRKQLVSHSEALGPKLDALTRNGTPFFETVLSDDGITRDVEGRPQSGFVIVSIEQWSAEKRRIKSSEKTAPVDAMQPNEMAFALGQTGLPLWSRSKNGDLLWSNEAFKELAFGSDPHDQATPRKMPAFFALPEQDAAVIARRRISLGTGAEPNQTQSWYNIHEHVTPDGSIFGYAEGADDIVKVETTLNRFVATLTESFAQLSTGLAIFDADRRLTIFNPAIADLMQIDPSWLASRPGFRDFMSRVREGQMMPEQKTAADWKRRIRQIEKEAGQGTLSEKWVLPSGQTFKVSGRPHPHGAIALMIEDISTHISLERQYQSEIEQSRATLDFLTEAVCVFDTTGAMVYANSACAELWGFDAKDAVDHLNIVKATADWGAACKPTPVWGDLREFVTSLDQRAAWTADIALENGPALSSVFAPLPDGSTLAIFTNTSKLVAPDTSVDDRLAAMTRAHKEEISILELAIDHMREAVKTITADQNLSPQPAANETTPPCPLENSVSYADRLLLMRRDEIPENEGGLDTLSQDLLALLKEKEAELSLSCEPLAEDGDLAADLKRLLINIMLVTRSLVAPGENVDLSVAEMEEGLSISCMFKGLPDLTKDPEKSAGLTYRIMSRYLEELDGEGTIDLLDNRDFIKITCTIPKPRIATLSKDRSQSAR